MNLKVIQVGILYLDDCLDLDQKTLKGLWTKSQWQRELINPKRISLGIIEFETKKLLGLCCAWSVIDELHITFIAVDPKHQRRGLGKSLMSNIIKYSKSFQTIQIFLEVKVNNEPAIAFYKSIGFKAVGYRTNFYKDGSDALILSRETKKQL